MKLTKEAKVLIIDHTIGKIIGFFSGVFLTSYFFKISTENMLHLSIYHIVVWVAATIGAVIVIDYIKRKNKVTLYRIGMLINLIYIFSIVLLKERMIDYVWLIGLLYGFTVATSGFPLNMIASEQIEMKERTKYLGYKEAASELVSLIFPIIMGAYITVSSYETLGIFILFLSIGKLINSTFIKNKNTQSEKIEIHGFLQELKKQKKPTIQKLYLLEFLKGLTMQSGAMKLIVSLLIIYEFQSDLDLGIWTSVFALLGFLVMFLFGKYYDKKRPKKVLFLCALSSVLSLIAILISMNLYTIILYNIVFYTFATMLWNLTDIRLYDYSSIEPYKNKYNTEYFLFRELYLNAGRVLGFVMLLVIAVLKNMELLKIQILFMTIIIVIITILSNRVSKEDDCLYEK